MNTKFTPGPWRVGPVDDTVVTDAAGNEVAAIDGDYNSPGTWPQMEANARLIAAAPCMAEYIRRKAGEGCAEAARLLAKAEGRDHG